MLMLDMFDSPWFVASGIAFLALALSLIPERYRIWVIVTSLIIAVGCFYLGWTRQGEPNGPPNIQVVGLSQLITNPDKKTACMRIPIHNAGGEADDVVPTVDLTIGDELYPHKEILTKAMSFVPNGDYSIETCPWDNCYERILRQEPLLVDVRIDYRFHRERHSYCFHGDWDYGLRALGYITSGDCAPMSNAPSRDWLTPVLMAYGSVFMIWYVLFCLLRWNWRPSWWQRASSWLGNVDES
jgi:hypothetical protein